VQINKLVVAGHVRRINVREADATDEAWYVPHHKFNHKDRVVFNCSFQVGKQCLNSYIKKFRQEEVAISGDIKGMFHQVRLLDEDKPLMRFLWRDHLTDEHPSVYQWEVLPFGTTCSPCCATYILQRHVTESSEQGEDVRYSVECCLYMDNCLQSVTTEEEARGLVTKLRAWLEKGGFDLRQWASNNPNDLRHLPAEAKSESSETWVSQTPGEAHEMTVGLILHFKTDTLHYQHNPTEP